MNRPKITKELVAAAVAEIATETGIPAETIAAAYSRYMDGYQLARELERYHWIDDLTMAEVDALDRAGFAVDRAQQKAEEEWVIQNNIQPKLKVGDVIDKGVISGISERSPARYLVKENGCTQKGRFLLVNFEDAEKQPTKGD
jgi:hypothetical protein